MKVKKLLAGVLAGTLVLGSLAVVSAAEISGESWWGVGNEKSESVQLEDGSSVSFNIEVAVTSSAGDYAACVVEACDVQNNYYCTTTSDGDCWGNGTPTTDTGVATMVQGGSYTVTMTRDGNYFTATYVDNETGESIFETLTLVGNVDFGETVVYVMAEVGTFDVTVAEEDTEDKDDSDDEDENEDEDDDDDSDVEDDDTDDNDDSDVEDDDTDVDDDSDDDDDNDEEELKAADYNTVVDEYTLEDQYCDGWWTTFSQAIELVEGTKTVITGVTTNCSTFNWNNIIYVLYSSDDGNVYPADSDEAIATNYTEYFVGRADDYGWGVVDFTVLSEPADWDEWLAETQAGAEFTIEALYVDGTVQITITCLDASYVITYAVEDPDTPIYLALTGEDCQLSDLSVVVYEASEDEIVDVDELISETDETVDDDDASAAAAAAVSGVKTADASLLLLIVLALAGCSAIAFVAKKRA